MALKRLLLILFLTIIFSWLFFGVGFFINKAEAALINRIASTTCSNGGATTISCSLAPQNGDALIAIVGTRGTADNRVSSITQTGAVWTRAIQVSTSSGATTEIWYALNISGATASITITLAASMKASAIIAEYSGIATSNALDKVATSTGRSATPRTGITTMTSQSDELWIGALNATGTATYSAPSNNFILIGNALSTGGGAATKNSAEYLEKIISANGTATTTATLSLNATWSGAIATFKAATSSISQNAYGWFENLDSADLATIYENPSTGNDFANTVAMGSARGFLYVAGFDQASGHDEWRVEKRKLSNGELIYGISTPYTGSQINAMAIDTIEGTIYSVGGVSTISPKWIIEKRNLSDGSLVYSVLSDLPSCFGVIPRDCEATTVALDVGNGVMYVAGSGSNDSDLKWRIEKRYLVDGSLVPTFGANGVIAENPSTSFDEIWALALDASSGMMYAAGKYAAPGEWRIEKRSLADGSFIPSFGSGGAITTTFGTGADWPNAIALDTDSGAMYVVGRDWIPGNQEWRIEKRNLSDGILLYSVTSNPSSASDEANAIVLDTASSTMYVGGYDSIPGDPNFQWRVEKRNMSNGSLATSTFGVNGAFTMKPNVGSNMINSLALDKDNNALYAAGYDTTSSSDSEIQIEKINALNGISMDWGALISPQNTSTTSPGQGTPFRLRMLLGVSTKDLATSGLSFKLQFASSSGVCDINFAGENYSDVGTSTAIRYYNNPYPSDGASLISTANDLTFATSTIINETYEELNPFTNSQSVISAGSNGKWDFSLVDASSTPDTSYCFRIVKSDNNLLNNYNFIPEIKTRGRAPKISSAANQIFTLGQDAIYALPITITSGSGATGAITKANGVRVQIASSSVNMQWNTSVTAPNFSGSAAASTTQIVSYPDPYTLVINPTSDWPASSTLIISNLVFTNFNSVNYATSALLLYVGTSTDATVAAIDDKSVFIQGSSALADFTSGQEQNLLDSDVSSLNDVQLYRFALRPTGENMNVINTTISIASAGGFSSSDISNPRLYLDLDGNGAIDAGEPPVAATGTISLDNGMGAINFIGAWSLGIASNIIFKANVSNISEGNYINLSLDPSKLKLRGALTANAISSIGKASDANHARSFRSRGGGSGRGGGPEGGMPNQSNSQGGGRAGDNTITEEQPVATTSTATSTPSAGGGEGGTP